jgi:exopolysaccharide production protein ExoY
MVTTLILGIIGSVIGRIFYEELGGWGPKIASLMLDRAVRSLPRDRRDRYREEWAAHIDSMPTAFSKLLTGFGISFAAIHMRITLLDRQQVAKFSGNVAMRSMDIGFGTFAIIIFQPIITIIALIIYVTSPGPVFFAHRRIGKGGREFSCYKIRTMYMDSQARLDAYLADNPLEAEAWRLGKKLSHDPRIMPIGRILRTSSLDELPQFYNVVGGSMSLVGPRPIVHAERKRYGRWISDYESVRPGLTGLWQFKLRSDTTYRRRVALDVAFARHRSFRLFVLIMAMTVPAVLTTRFEEKPENRKRRQHEAADERKVDND